MLIVVGAIATWAPLRSQLDFGQLSGLLLFPYALAWRADRRGRPVLAALWLGVAGSLKPFRWLWCAVFIAAGRIRPALFMVVTAAAAVVIGGAVHGWRSLTAWFHALGSSTPWYAHPANGSLAGLIVRAWSTAPWALLMLLAATFSIITIVVAECETDLDRRHHNRCVLASPLGWIYYGWLLVPSALARIAAGLWPAWKWVPLQSY